MSDRTPMSSHDCDYCFRTNPPWSYLVNPRGGYGFQCETRICSDCVNKPENQWVRKRLIDVAGWKEQELNDR